MTITHDYEDDWDYVSKKPKKPTVYDDDDMSDHGTVED